MQSQFDFPYNSPKRRSAWIPFMAPGIYLTPNIVYDCCKAEL